MFGMTRKTRIIRKPLPHLRCHPEELTTRDLQSRRQAGGRHEPEKTLARRIAKL
jgi:hypothetical protein